MTASCLTCSIIVRTSVIDANGVKAVHEISAGDFLSTEVMETETVMRAVLEVGNGRVIYGPL